MNVDVTKRNLITFDKKYKLDVSDIVINNKIELEIVCKDPLIIVIKNLLSKSQCDQLIEKTCKIKYGTIQHEYNPSVRDNKRILCMSNEFADMLWNIIKDKLNELDELKDMRPDGFATEGKWIANNINPCFRFSEYNAPSVGFKHHRDTTFIKDFNNRSIFTMIGYLNNNFEGGSTTFYKSDKSYRAKGHTVEEEMKNGYKKIYEYVPVIGSAILFSHNTIHCGNPLDGTEKKQTKYIFRTDIVFKGGVNQYKITDPDFQIAVLLTRQAQIYEMKGEIDKASECYERAISIRQCQNDINSTTCTFIPKSSINFSDLLVDCKKCIIYS